MLPSSIGQRLRQGKSPPGSADVTAFLPLPLLGSRAAECAAVTIWFTVAPRGKRIKSELLALFLKIYGEYAVVGATTQSQLCSCGFFVCLFSHYPKSQGIFLLLPKSSLLTLHCIKMYSSLEYAFANITQNETVDFIAPKILRMLNISYLRRSPLRKQFLCLQCGSQQGLTAEVRQFFLTLPNRISYLLKGIGQLYRMTSIAELVR